METCKNFKNDDKISVVTNQALLNFENMRRCIQGLNEILMITLSSEDIYFQIGQDNIEALYENFLELMLNTIGANELMKRLQKSEIDLDLSPDDLLK